MCLTSSNSVIRTAANSNLFKVCSMKRNIVQITEKIINNRGSKGFSVFSENIVSHLD